MWLPVRRKEEIICKFRVGFIPLTKSCGACWLELSLTKGFFFGNVTDSKRAQNEHTLSETITILFYTPVDYVGKVRIQECVFERAYHHSKSKHARNLYNIPK